jgi:hypothetical protein
MDRILFVVGIALCFFMYGAATLHYKIFPYPLLREARLGLAAWGGMETAKRRFPMAFDRFEEGAPGEPQARRLGPGAGEELVLITGGPYQLMERCPTWGCMAWITDRTGNIRHTWEVDLEELWSGLSGVAGDVNRLSLYPVGMALGNDGSLVVTFQGRNTYPVHIGIAKLDRQGRILWKRFDRSHHWIAMDAEGRVYTPFSASHKKLDYIGATRVDVTCETGETYVDAIRVLGADGKPVRELPVMEALLQAGRSGWFYNVRDGCNPTHLNSIDLAPESAAKAIPGAAAGDLLVSLRETNTVALLDAATGAVKRVIAGFTAAQHSPRFLPDGTVLVFDNLGGDRRLGGTRVVRLDLVKGTAQTLFPSAGDQPLLPVYSETAGHIDVSPDGRRALIAITHQGRVVEIDVASGTPSWVYDNTHDIARFLEAHDMNATQTRARFATYGAYYVTGVDFLKEGP